jgi:chromosome segregation ATPase
MIRKTIKIRLLEDGEVVIEDVNIHLIEGEDEKRIELDGFLHKKILENGGIKIDNYYYLSNPLNPHQKLKYEIEGLRGNIFLEPPEMVNIESDISLTSLMRREDTSVSTQVVSDVPAKEPAAETPRTVTTYNIEDLQAELKSELDKQLREEYESKIRHLENKVLEFKEEAELLAEQYRILEKEFKEVDRHHEELLQKQMYQLEEYRKIQKAEIDLPMIEVEDLTEMPLEDMVQDIISLQKQIKSLQVELDKAREKLAGYEKKESSYKMEGDRDEIRGLEEELTKTQGELKEKTEAYDRLEKAANDLRERGQEIERKNIVYQSEILELENKLKQLELDFQNKEGEYLRKIMELEKALQKIKKEAGKLDYDNA